MSVTTAGTDVVKASLTNVSSTRQHSIITAGHANTVIHTHSAFIVGKQLANTDIYIAQFDSLMGFVVLFVEAV